MARVKTVPSVCEETSGIFLVFSILAVVKMVSCCAVVILRKVYFC